MIQKAGGIKVRGRMVEGNADYFAVIKDTELSLQVRERVGERVRERGRERGGERMRMSMRVSMRVKLKVVLSLDSR